jgi:hypothetical protein
MTNEGHQFVNQWQNYIYYQLKALHNWCQREDNLKEKYNSVRKVDVKALWSLLILKWIYWNGDLFLPSTALFHWQNYAYIHCNMPLVGFNLYIYKINWSGKHKSAVNLSRFRILSWVRICHVLCFNRYAWSNIFIIIKIQRKRELKVKATSKHLIKAVKNLETKWSHGSINHNKITGEL